MAIKHKRRLVTCLMAATWLAGLSPASALARSHHQGTGSPPPSSESRSNSSQPTNGGNTPIAVQQERPAGLSNKSPPHPFVVTPAAPRGFQSNRTPTASDSQNVVHNAIGIAVPAPPQGTNLLHGSPPPVSLAATPPAAVDRGSVGIVRTEIAPRSQVRLQPNTILTHGAVAGGGAINGSALGRPGLNPSRIGGPAQVSAGISGTSVHRKH